MKLYGTPYSHVYVRFKSESFDRELIYQASNSMVNFMGLETFLKNNLIYKEFSIDITSENRKNLVQFAIDMAGRPYSIKEAIGLGLVKIASWFGKKIKNPWGDGTQGFVCSVLAAYILENFLGEDVPDDFEDADPEKIYNFLSSKLPSAPNS